MGRRAWRHVAVHEASFGVEVVVATEDPFWLELCCWRCWGQESRRFLSEIFFWRAWLHVAVHEARFGSEVVVATEDLEDAPPLHRVSHQIPEGGWQSSLQRR